MMACENCQTEVIEHDDEIMPFDREVVNYVLGCIQTEGYVQAHEDALRIIDVLNGSIEFHRMIESFAYVMKHPEQYTAAGAAMSLKDWIERFAHLLFYAGVQSHRTVTQIERPKFIQ